ncbi:hypothetical protein BBO99_00002456 [Phytophthora kernoviae]|uniref:Uncharacterized protein n=2 Tax=Phytophthora kernoviae TaxID=325452 RepID=A0A3R7K1Y2_9STRA|nr:hypothetical protein G195_004214 [Phytophthora kernoviae 00238/432]KAG2528563.1 hypothetical protein JM18_002029 [Phytophthora kernoviae]RLN31896.1 hypothetical protein BBI17_000526 [Phytophthora kernoviae]RLN83043.1 hypothetical protein BBO99_00002456 [Phytophthora kernoviae]
MEDGGPQAERSRRLATQGLLNSLPKPVKDAKPVVRAPPPPSCVSGCCVESTRLADERDFLRGYTERLLVQLRTLLQRYGELEKLKTLADVAQDDEMTQERLAPWLTASEYANPLLQAYDLKIQELEIAVGDNKKAMDRAAARAEGLAKENTALRQELEAAAEKMVLRMQNEPKAMNDDWMNIQENGEYLQEINERIDVLMAENNMLMEQVSLQDDEIGAMKKELMDRDQQLQVMGQNFNDATLALQELRDACSQVREEKTHCERQLQRYAASIAQLESAKDSLVEQTDAVRRERDSLEIRLGEYEEMLEKMKMGGERKDESFSVRYQSVCIRLRELTNALEQKDKTVDELQEQNSELQAEFEAVRQDCEGMLNVMNSMEKQLTQYCAREDAVAELESECKTKVDEVILEKEEVAARELQSRREIARLLEKLQQQAAEHERVSSLERELEMRRTEAREAKDESEEQHRKVQLLNDQLNKVKADCANRFTNEFEVLHQQNRDLKAQAGELEYKLSQAKKESVSALNSSQNERERCEMARKKLEEYRSSSYSFIPFSHSRMQPDNFDRKEALNGTTRIEATEKLDPAEKSKIGYHTST